MTFLPIVARELRVASRRRGTFWTRTVVALGAIGVGIFFYLANIEAAASLLAHRIFYGLIGLGIIFCLFAGRRFTADCLSEEKRGGTLGLLFLTDLKGYDIVLGKLAATSLNGFYSLLAVFPVFAVPMLIGGITQGEFWRAVLVLASTFLFSLAVGIFVSALSRDYRSAMGANLLVLLFIIGVPGGSAGLMAYFLPSQPFHREYLCSCPLYALWLSADSTYGFGADHFWWSIGLIQALTWILLWLASYTVRRCWQDRPVEPRASLWKRAWAFYRFGPSITRATYRRRLLDRNAFLWLAARARLKPLHVWLVLLCVAGWWLGALLQFGPLWLSEGFNGVNIATAIMLNIALKLWVGLETCRELAEDRQSNAFELLLSTPMTVRDIVEGQWLALKRQFLVPVLVSFAVALLFMFGALRHSPTDHAEILIIWLGAMLMFLADSTALFWTGLHSAVTSRTPNQAAVLTISRIVIGPGVLFAAVIALVNAYSYLAGRPGPDLGFYLAWWFGLGVTADLIYGVSGRRQFLTRFRYLASLDRRRMGSEVMTEATPGRSPKAEGRNPKETRNPKSELSEVCEG